MSSKVIEVNPDKIKAIEEKSNILDSVEAV